LLMKGFMMIDMVNAWERGCGGGKKVIYLHVRTCLSAV
jgi:hypothetical protein